MPRMKILNALEQEEFETPPLFNSAERRKFFDFSVGIIAIADSLRTSTNKICFFLLSGYFRATKKFFSGRFHQHDVNYLAQKYLIKVNQADLLSYDKQAYGRHRRLILNFYGFREFDEAIEKAICQEITAMANSQLKPKLIFFQTIELFIRHKVQIPSYDFLSKLILEQIRNYKEMILRTIEENLHPKGKQLLDSLLEKVSSDSSIDASPKTQRYRLTLLKKFSQSTKPAKIRASVEDLQTLQSIYMQLESVIDALSLSLEGIRYYAGSVIRSEIFQVARRADEDRYLHMLAFIAHQYFGLQDTLIDIVLKVTRSFFNTAKQEHKEICYEDRQQRNQTFRKLVNFVDDNLLGTLLTIKSITDSTQLADTAKIEQIKLLLAKTEPQCQQMQEQIGPLKKESETKLRGEDFFRILEDRSVKLQNKTAVIIKNIIFQGSTSSANLVKAVDYYKRKDGVIDRNAPIDFLDPDEQKVILDAGAKPRVSLYKAVLTLKIADAIKSGTFNLVNSYKYRPLDDYLIARQDWENNQQSYIQRAGLESFADINKHMDQLRKSLDGRYHRTNQNILQNQNPYIKFRPNGTFTLSTPKAEEVETDPLNKLFPEKEYTSLLEILSTINRITGFLDEFEHWQVRHNRAKPNASLFLAGIVGYGCEIGTRKITKISRNITESELENTINWYFTIDNINNAIDRILKFITQLDLPNLYRRLDDKLHTSSDGQKFEVDTDSLNASYSFKYFGKGKGVSVYSFIDERNLLFHSNVISAAERESAYAIDGLMHNNVVKSDIHSTDTHGYSEAIFATMHLLGFSFAPRIKNLKKQHLYTFENKRQYEEQGYKILPQGYIDTALIEENWNDILRFIATIKLKISTASDIFRRLNSYSKQHTLYKALKEFGKIPKSEHILTWIDDPVHRQAVEKQLNKIESSHKLSKAVSVGNSRQFSQGEKHEQEVAEGCKRLIKNAIICWNYLYLSQKIADELNPERRMDLIESVRHGSVVAWQHINMLGEYDFSDEKLQDSMRFQLSKILDLKASDFGAKKIL